MGDFRKDYWSDWVDWYQCPCGARGAYRKEHKETKKVHYFCVKCHRTNTPDALMREEGELLGGPRTTNENILEQEDQHGWQT